ncbi:MAG TPA: hypothetical protein VGR45_02985 [Stellaceae bacterium]|nr:hypothetical protein [Stellaceae bacterium]
MAEPSERKYTVGSRNERLFWIDDPDGETVVAAIGDRDEAEDWAVELQRAFDLGRREERERWRWRSVKDDPPPVNTSVLIWLPNWEHYGPGIYRAILVDMGTGKRWHTTAWAVGRDLGGDDWPELWRPLPELPNG